MALARSLDAPNDPLLRRRTPGEADPTDPPDAGGPPPDEPSPGPPQLGPLPIAGLTRRHLAFGLGALVVLWIVLVFARAVADSAAVTGRAATLRVENAQLQAQLEARRRELEVVRSPAYVAIQGRAYGVGGPGERPFSLTGGAPRPVIHPLGSDPASRDRQAPLEAWLELLFGD
ncbi:MAG TPA: hypothetical protein VFK38_09510 [Candidatus Limnocylindrales bacterium]|nr:hypothetical protein [Candidatus Limnocylindrales bacterium]